ncbi:SDR family oxidoreductase [Pseudomonas nabeulensis]|uniref:SDR family oxidoreductase n=1 Tax=Pseudomonas nabeulensis TaxID=2293833 RepID=A0A4Z0AHQ9_9PSED|nr:SDR family oxidoreductase [Pseudomonas nabeulensis]TFY85518.1 SDR family oxidoreductase [Pseudomonas nabeulensis]
MFRLDGKIAVITGGSQGIGQGIAEVFASAGAEVVIAARGANSEKVVAIIEANGGKARWIKADISTAEGATALVEQVLAQYGKIDVLVHNAAFVPVASIEDLQEQQLDDTFAVNLKAAFWLTRAVVPSMRAQKQGRLLFTSSVTGPRVAMPLLAHYAASKAGLNGFIKAASLEYARDGITVNAVEPGFVHTPALVDFMTDEEMERLASQIPVGRLGQPRDIGYAMLFLASSEAAYVTGESIIVDGGACTPESPDQLQNYYANKA